jgi:hypothetical protein
MDKIPEVFKPHDIKEIVKKIEGYNILSKSEFETTENLRERIDQAYLDLSHIDGKPFGLIFFEIPVRNNLKYDADSENMRLLFRNNTASRSNFYKISDMYDKEADNIRDKFPRIIEIAYKTEEKANKEIGYQHFKYFETMQYEIAFKWGENRGIPEYLEFPVSLKEAEGLKPNLAIAIVGEMDYPILLRESTRLVNNSTEKITNIIKNKITMKNIQIWIYNKANFEIIKKFDSKLVPII